MNWYKKAQIKISNEEYIADQLLNAWEYSSPEEMIKWLSDTTDVSPEKIASIVNE